jgi:hypothetical protein
MTDELLMIIEDTTFSVKLLFTDNDDELVLVTAT